MGEVSRNGGERLDAGPVGSRSDPDLSMPEFPTERAGGLSLRTRLLVPVLIALIPAFLVLLANAMEDRELNAARARWRAFGVLTTSVAQMERLVESSAVFLQTVADMSEVRRLDRAALETLLPDMLERSPEYRRLEVTDPLGRLVAGAGTLGPQGPPEAEPGLRAALLAGRPAMALEPQVSPGRGGLRLAVPIRDRRGEVVGTVSATVDLDWVGRRVATAELPENAELNVADLDGVLVFRVPSSSRWLGMRLPPDMLRMAEGQPRRSVERNGLDGVPRLYRPARLRQPDGTPLGTVSLGIPLDVGDAQAEQGLARDLGLMALIAFVSLGTAWVGGEWLLLRRIRVLSRTIHRLACLDYKARTGLPHRGDALGRLAWAFDVMADRLERSRQRELSLLKSAGEAICGVDRAGRIVFANAAAEDLLGVPATELPGLPLEGFLVRKGEVGVALERTLQARTRQTAEAVELRRADGTVVPVDYTSAPMEEPPGAQGAVVVMRDVSERTRARLEVEEAQRRLLQATQEKKAFYREILRAATGGRFHLVDAGEIPTEGTEVLDLPLEREGYVQVREELPGLARRAGLTAEQGMDLLVLFGEAASNAIKHGVDGRCQVSVGPDRVRLRVSDRGPGIQPDRLPATLFESGYSTKVSLGMGYTLMLQMADALWLATGPEGTTLQVELVAQRVLPEEKVLEALMARF